MKRVAGDGDRRRRILFLDLRDDRVSRIVGFFHRRAPSTEIIREAQRWFPPAAATGAAALLASCSGEFSALDPAGPSATSIAGLWWVMLAAAAVLFALVLGLLLATFLIPRFGRSLSPRAWIVGGGLLMPLPLLLVLTFYAFWQGEYLLRGAGAAATDVFRVEVLATRWEWRFSYPSLAGSRPTTNLLHIPAGRTVEIAVESADVIHSFWVPRLGGKMDAVPGHTTYLRLRADRPGRYGGICSEYCGTGHAGMRFEVRAHAEEDFAAALGMEEGQ